MQAMLSSMGFPQNTRATGNLLPRTNVRFETAKPAKNAKMWSSLRRASYLSRLGIITLIFEEGLRRHRIYNNTHSHVATVSSVHKHQSNLPYPRISSNSLSRLLSPSSSVASEVRILFCARPSFSSLILLHSLPQASSSPLPPKVIAQLRTPLLKSTPRIHPC